MNSICLFLKKMGYTKWIVRYVFGCIILTTIGVIITELEQKTVQQGGIGEYFMVAGLVGFLVLWVYRDTGLEEWWNSRHTRRDV